MTQNADSVRKLFYPNGQCPTCGFGLDEDYHCTNEDCSDCGQQMAEDDDGFFGTVVKCPRCMGGRNVQMGVGPTPLCKFCDGSGMVIERAENDGSEAAIPQTENEARECIHGVRVWFGHECGTCMDEYGKFLWAHK